MTRSALPWLLTPLVLSSAWAQSDPAVEQQKREEEFAKTMTGCRMVGHFTVTGSDAPPKEDSYTISKVSKLRGDRWRFDAKIEYGGKSVTVPIVVPVSWAGDTPVIEVTDLAIPMLGTYTARVVIYRNRYAGLWQGSDHGGHMFGKIERRALEAPPPAGETASAQWPSWRGPLGTGAAPGSQPPLVWSETENVRWKVPVPGRGSSTPVVFGDRIYLTTAIRTDEDGTPPETERPQRRGRGRFRRGGGGRRGGFGGGERSTKLHRFVVMALDCADGSVVWSRDVNKAVPHERGHATSSLASNSPVTDGEVLVASFGSRGVYGLDLTGKVLWSVDLGLMYTSNEFGEGSSPALHGDVVVVNWDHEGDSFVVALDKRTGAELWRHDRDEGTSWSTPLVVDAGDRPQVVIAATGASRGYDLATGELLWTLPGMTRNVIPSPLAQRGLCYLMSGYGGASLQAVRLAGARGELAGTDHVVWQHDRQTSYVPSALLYGDYLYFVRRNTGTLSCLDARTGEVQYEGKRLGLRTVYGSPLGAGGRVYVTSREGSTVVLKQGPGFEELAHNDLDDGFDASAVAVGDALYLRGHEHLYCLAER